MTTDEVAVPRMSGPSIHVVRARKLLWAGICGGVFAALVCLVTFGILDGSRGLGSAALASAMVLFFYIGGQLVMVMFADAGARILLLVSMASYSMRIVVLGLVLLSYDRHRESWPSLSPLAIFVTTIAVVAGWLAVEVFVFSRLRIGIYDTEYVAPSTESEGS